MLKGASPAFLSLVQSVIALQRNTPRPVVTSSVAVEEKGRISDVSGPSAPPLPRGALAGGVAGLRRGPCNM